MAQPSVANYFSNRKRTVVDDVKINRARKVLVLDSSKINSKTQDGLGDVISSKINCKNVYTTNKILDKLQEKEEKTVVANKIVPPVNSATKNVPKKTTRTTRTKKVTNNKDIQELFSNMTKKDTQETILQDDIVKQRHVTPPNTPSKINAMDKVTDKNEGHSIKEIKKKMSRSGRLAELKASLQKFKEKDEQLKEIEKKTSIIPESPKIKSFRTIELEVCTSPKRLFSPEKAYLSPKKDLSARRNLIGLLSPTKNAVSLIPQSPAKRILEETSKPGLTLPHKYRCLAEMFRSIDTVTQILFNRKENITFKKLKPAVEEMLKKNITEKHVAQIKHIYPESFTLTQEKLRVFGAGMKKEAWELVFNPNLGKVDHMTSECLLERRRTLFGRLVDKVKNYHTEFLESLDPLFTKNKDEIRRWHPLFDIESVPDIELGEVPQPPNEEKFTTGKDVLDRAREMFNCNTRMEQALMNLKRAKEANPELIVEEKPKELPTSVLKGIPKALLEKVRQKQAAKALVSMTRSADKEKEVQMYCRLPELARLARNLFVSEKKGVLPFETVVEKMGNCYRSFLTKTDMGDHLKLIAKEVPGWLVFHDIRNTMYIKLNKNADLSIVTSKLETLVKQKSEL